MGQVFPQLREERNHCGMLGEQHCYWEGMFAPCLLNHLQHWSSSHPSLCPGVRDAVPRTHRCRVAKSCSSVSCLKQHRTSQPHAAQGCFSVSALFCHGRGCRNTMVPPPHPTVPLQHPLWPVAEDICSSHPSNLSPRTSLVSAKKSALDLRSTVWGAAGRLALR